MNNDLISRQQAIDAVDVYMKRLCRYIGTSDDTRAYAFARGLLVGIKTDIGELPFAEPKRIRGKWIHDGGKWKNRWICSNCGYKWFFDCIEGAYCPNCGADMRKETT